jgi:tRNA dimethylallyltransferase
MDIGTAKPSLEEREGIPHYMLDVADPNEPFSVSRYCQMATPILEDINARGKTAIVVGGTGLYMDALIRGNDFAPYPATGRREELEAIAAKEGIEKVIEMLRLVDPESANRLHPSDQKRIIRAMEVYLETGKSITQHNLETQAIPPRFDATWFALQDENRQDLYDRIDGRVDKMLELGLLQEIKDLFGMGISPKATAMQAIGYKEFIDYLAGNCALEDACAQVQQSSRHYAKRQLTWFRKNPQIHWLTRKPGQQTQEILQSLRQVLVECDN